MLNATAGYAYDSAGYGGPSVSSSSSSNIVRGPQGGGPAYGEQLSGFSQRLILGYLDRATLYPKWRWGFFLICVLFLGARILWFRAFFVVCYAWAIYLLNLFIGFLSPQADIESEEYVLPVREVEEYRPFQRRLPEFKFWLRGTTGTLLAIGATLFPVFDLPVYWPILFIYFMMLFFMTMKQQIKHKYVPFSWGKQTYGHITRGAKPKKPHQLYAKKQGISFPSVKSSTHTS